MRLRGAVRASTGDPVRVASHMGTSTLRIVHAVSSLNGGGMEHFVLRLAEAQRRHGHDASILALRGGPLAGKYVLVCTRPFEEWVLARHPGECGKPIELLPEHRFSSREEAEWAVFRMRWKQHTGEELN